MNHKIMLALVMSCLAFQGCAKKETPENTSETEQVSQDQLKLDTIKKMYAINQKHHFENETLYHFSTDYFQSLLDKKLQAGVSGCGFEHNLLMQTHYPDYTSNQYSFSLTPEGHVLANVPSGGHVIFVLECQSDHCAINDVISNDHSVAEIIKQDDFDRIKRLEDMPPFTHPRKPNETFAPTESENDLQIQDGEKIQTASNSN